MRYGFQSNDFSDSNVLGCITKSMVLVSPFVKICDFFFLIDGVLDSLEPHRRNKKKRKKRHYWDTGVWRIVLILVSDMRWTPTRRQKCRVGAT